MRPFIKFWLLILLPSVAYGCLGRNPIKHDDSSGSSNGGPKSTYNDWLQDLYSEYKPGSACDRIELVKRDGQDGWGAVSPKSSSDITGSVNKIFIHHTAGKKCMSKQWCSKELRGIQEYHMNNPNRMYSDIAYSFLVGEDARIYEGRGWGVVGAHTYGYNSKSYGIAFMGNYMKSVPSRAALKAAKNLIACGVERGSISTSYGLYGHSDFKITECPADQLYQEIRDWSNYAGASTPVSTTEAPETPSNNGPNLYLTTEERNSLEQQLRIDEGVEYEIYKDSLGFLTFGIGHLITEKDPEYGKPVGTRVSEERVKEAFAADLESVVKSVYSWSNDCNSWPSEVKEIIANMMFNLGLSNMNKFKNLKAAVQTRDWNKAADEMGNSRWATQVGARATRYENLVDVPSVRTSRYGAHLWNIQESSFVYTPSQQNQEKEINHDVLFREGQNTLKQTTFTPRLVAFDLKGSLNTLKQEGTLYEVAQQENIKWLGDITMHAEDAGPKNRFLVDLEGEEDHSKSVEDSDEKDRIEREMDELNNPENELEKQVISEGTDSEVFGPKLYDLDSSVTVWSDYLRTHYHPKSVHIIEEYRHNAELHPFDLFCCGNQALGNYSATCELEDRIHFFTEECDSLQGFHVFLDTHNGFGGLGSGLLKYLEEEFPGKGILTYGFTPADHPDDTPQSRSTRIINSALAYDAASSHSSLFVPACLAKGLWRVMEPLIEFPNLLYKSMAYHTAAILASAIDTASVPYRLETNPCVLADITHSFNAQNRKMAAICSSMPFPLSSESSLVDVLTAHETKFPWQSLTPHFKSDTIPIMQSVVLRGIPQNHVTSRQSPGRLPRYLTGLSSADAILEAYLSNICPGKLFAKSVITSPLKTSIPYPHIFDQNVTKDGLPSVWKRPKNQGVESVPMMTSLQCNTGVGGVIGHLHSAAVKMNIKKHHKYIEMGLEEDEYLEAVDNLHALAGNYNTESEGL